MCPVLGRRRPDRRLAPGQPRVAGGWGGRGARHGGDDRDWAGRAHLTRNARACTWRNTSPLGGRLTEFVKRFTSAKIGIQLGHAGRKGSTQLDWEGPNEPLEDGDWPIVSASPIGFLRAQPGPGGAGRGGHGRPGRRLRALHGDGDRGRLRHRRDPHGARLPSRQLPVPPDQRAHRPLRREPGESAALPAAGGFGGPGAVAGRETALGAAVGGGLVARRQRTRGRGRDRAGAEGHGCDIVDVSTGQTVPYQRPRYGASSSRHRSRTGSATKWGSPRWPWGTSHPSRT